MKFGIVTLVSDNYGNKFQNYAVEQLLSTYGQVTTYRVAEYPAAKPAAEQMSKLQKLSPSYINQVMRMRMMYQYDLTNMERSALGNVIYAKKHHNSLKQLMQQRSSSFRQFSEEYLHVSDRVITRENCSDEAWIRTHDSFLCGSDQIWNPTYATTSELAFLSFAQGKVNTAAIAPSFGLSAIPEERRQDYSRWLKGIDSLSVREEAGQKIIRDLTGREAELLLDPTMMLSPEQWTALSVKPAKLPEHYILCYFLGLVDQKYRQEIRKVSQKTGLPVVMLFDIESPEYYTFGPCEVLYCLSHADFVMTDSFHGTVFSILFQRNFSVLERNEGNLKMSSRLETLLQKFDLTGTKNADSSLSVSEHRWKKTESILQEEQQHFCRYLEKAMKVNS